MMLSAKHMDIVMGIDIHLIITPAGPVVPIPHPFIGMVFDPLDWVPISIPMPMPTFNQEGIPNGMTVEMMPLNASVWINGVPRATAGTAAKNAPMHIPMGGSFAMPPGNEGEIFMGSSTVLADGDPLSYMALRVLSCTDVGMPAPIRPKKKGGAKSLLLPTSTVLPIPGGQPVLVGGSPTISMMQMAFKGGFALMGAFAKALKKTKIVKKVADKAHDIAAKAMSKLGVPPNARRLVHDAVCSVTGHPVDIASGRVFTDAIDFELPGPIPLQWSRSWHSTSVYNGVLGKGWHHQYDMALSEDDTDAIGIRLGDGRGVSFPKLLTGEKYYNRQEKLTLYKNEKGYFLEDSSKLLYKFQHYIGEIALLSEIADYAGNVVKFLYDWNGRLTEIIDSGGRKLSIFSENGRIVRIEAPHPEKEYFTFPIVSYQYDEQGRLVIVKDALNQSFTYHYQDNLLLKETNRNGLSFYFEYSGKNENAVCLRTYGDGGIYDHKLTYYPDHTIVINSLGHNTTHFHKGGVVVRKIDSRGAVETTEFNEFMEKVKETDAFGFATIYKYDDRGNQILVMAPDGATLKTEYDENDLLLKVQNPAGALYEWEYDEKQRIISRKDALGNEVKYRYEGALLTEIINISGNKTRLGYDAANNLMSLTTPDGQTSHWLYDKLSRCIQVTDPNGNIQKRIFDLLGQVKQLEEPDGNIRNFEYDGESNVTKASDKQHEVTFTYSGMNKLQSRKEAGTQVGFIYDTEEQLLGIVNEKRLQYRFELDSEGNVIQESGFDGLTRAYERDLLGQVKTVYRPNGLRTYYEYDLSGRVIRTEHSDKSWESFDYNDDGSLKEAVNAFAKVKLTRDILGRVIKEKQEIGEEVYEVLSKYDKLGNRTNVNSNLGAEFVYNFNIMGDVEDIKAGNFEAKFERDNMGLELQRELSGGIKSRWQRDRLGRPVEQQITGGSASRRRSYNWTFNNRITGIKDSLTGNLSFIHDDFGNLTGSLSENGEQEKRIADIVGNLFKTENKSDRSYGNGGQLLEDKLKGIRYEYDEEGYLKKKTERNGNTWLYEWYASGMLKKVIRPDNQEVVFEYDALGRRIKKAFGSKTTKWVWDGNLPLHEWQESEKITTWLFEEDSFAPLAKIEQYKSYGIISDHLGTPIEMYSESGSKVWNESLDIYGKKKTAEAYLVDCPFRYQGQYEDKETGLYYNGFRYYDPNIGIFISQDPIALEGGIEMYRYVHDTNYWLDELGLAKSCGSGTQRWKNKKTKSGKPYKKPGPKTNPRAPHNKKIREIIKREKAKGSKHIGGGSKTEITIDTTGGLKDTRRMDTSFRDGTGNEYHINVGKQTSQGNPIKRERDAINDVTNAGRTISFEPYN